MDSIIPVQNKNVSVNGKELTKVLGAKGRPEVIYTDNSLEFAKACEDLSWNHCTSTPHTSETNVIAERAVRRVKEGTSAVLWRIPWNSIFICEIFKISCLMGKLHTKDVLGNHVKDWLFRLAHRLSITLSLRQTNQESINLERKFCLDSSSDTLCTRGEFGRVTYWSQTLRSWKRWTHLKSTRKDSMRKRWYFTKKKENLFFPVADGRIKPLGGDQDLRTPTLKREHPIRGESRSDFLGESEGSPPPPPQDSLPDAGEAINDFWSMSGNFIQRHHVEPRVTLYSPREESFPIPLKHIDVSRTAHTNLYVKQERRIDEYWNIDGARALSDSWTGFHSVYPI